MAAEYLHVKTELSKLRNYKAQLTEKIKQNQEMEELATPTQEDQNQFVQLKSEKVKSSDLLTYIKGNIPFG